MAQQKYINHSSEGFILWQDMTKVFHRHMAEDTIARVGGKILSAGFVTFVNGYLHCHGGSDSLGVKSTLWDTLALAKQLGMESDDDV